MGRGRRVQPAGLAGKLLEIRERFDLSQAQMFRRLGVTRSRIYVSHISGYELGTRESPLDVLLQYARVAGVPMEVFVDVEEAMIEWVLVECERSTRR